MDWKGIWIRSLEVESEEIQEKSIQEELAEGIISIIHSFSGKLYGMRNKIKEQLERELSDWVWC